LRYGPHSELVEEVIAFSRGDNVLGGVGKAEDTDLAYVINDFDLALNLLDADESRACQLVSCPHPDFDWKSIWDAFGLDLGIESDDPDDEFGWCGQLWGAIFNNHAGFVERDPTTYDLLRHSEKDLFNEFLENPYEKKLAQRLKHTMPWKYRTDQTGHAADLAMDAMSHLLSIAEARMYQGATNHFFEKMFEVFRLGMHPCGWRCSRPMPGKFIAYRNNG